MSGENLSGERCGDILWGDILYYCILIGEFATGDIYLLEIFFYINWGCFGNPVYDMQYDWYLEGIFLTLKVETNELHSGLLEIEFMILFCNSSYNSMKSGLFSGFAFNILATKDNNYKVYLSVNPKTVSLTSTWNSKH